MKNSTPTADDNMLLVKWLEEESADPCSSELNVFELAERLVQVAEALRTLTKRNATFSKYLDIPEHDCGAEAITEHCVALTKQLEQQQKEADADLRDANQKRLAVLEQHQWHRVEDGNPKESSNYQVFYRGEIGWLHWDHQLKWTNEHCFEEHPTHWRYSTPPEQVSKK